MGSLEVGMQVACPSRAALVCCTFKPKRLSILGLEGSSAPPQDEDETKTNCVTSRPDALAQEQAPPACRGPAPASEPIDLTRQVDDFHQPHRRHKGPFVSAGRSTLSLASFSLSYPLLAVESFNFGPFLELWPPPLLQLARLERAALVEVRVPEADAGRARQGDRAAC